MMHTTSVRLNPSATSPDQPVVKETVEMFLARGGRITHCPTKPAQGAMMYTPTIAVDGHEIPVGVHNHEYLPNFVRDLPTYDKAQQEVVTTEDDGTASLVRQDLHHSMRPTIEWRDRHNRTLRRDDTDVMEEMV